MQIRRQRHGENRNVTCPICLITASFPVETNCGHIFCGKIYHAGQIIQLIIYLLLLTIGVCIVQYWQHMASNLVKIKCPMCRQDVSCLLPLYSRREADQHRNDETMKRVFTSIQSYNRRFSGAPRNVILSISAKNIIINLLISSKSTGITYRIFRSCYGMYSTSFFHSMISVYGTASDSDS